MANNITLSQTEDIAIVTMGNSDQANTIDIPFCEGLLKALNDVKISQQYRAVVLRANGRVFSAGGDLAQILEGLDKHDGSLEALISAFHAVILAIRGLRRGRRSEHREVCSRISQARDIKRRRALLSAHAPTRTGASA